jgi:dimethylsulfone monooxygenase
MATLAAIGAGRAGLNIVAGWNAPEYAALGLELPADHVTRYAYAQEWFDIVEALWTGSAPLDHNGTFFHLAGAFCDPRPVKRPLIINAAGSEDGQNFAIRNADMLFTPAIDLAQSKRTVEKLKRQADAAGREIGVLTGCHIVCRATEKDARKYAASFMGDMIDHEAVDQLIRLQIAHAKSIPHDALLAIRERMAMGHGAFPIIGTPEQVAEGLTAIYEAGFSGTTMSFFDYTGEFPYFRDEVLPLLEQAGLRAPAAAGYMAP